MRPTRDAVDDWCRILQIRGVEPMGILVHEDRMVAVTTPEGLGRVIDLYGTASDILGLFLAEEDGKHVAVDNSDGCAWTEEFWTKGWAIRWLVGDCRDTDHAHHRDDMVHMLRAEGSA